MNFYTETFKIKHYIHTDTYTYTNWKLQRVTIFLTHVSLPPLTILFNNNTENVIPSQLD